MSRAVESKQLINAAPGTYKFTLLGGRYAATYSGTGTPGTVDLNILAPDGVTYIKAAMTTIAATTGFQTGLDLPPGSYEVVIATLTANYFALTRVPQD